jgi:hypothetical protein
LKNIGKSAIAIFSRADTPSTRNLNLLKIQALMAAEWRWHAPGYSGSIQTQRVKLKTCTDGDTGQRGISLRL